MEERTVDNKRFIEAAQNAETSIRLAELLHIADAEIDRRKAQLWKYGKHLAACALWKSMANRCTCGWVDVRATLAPVKPRPEDSFNASIAPTHSSGGDEHA
jgi:hypothetical protein